MKSPTLPRDASGFSVASIRWMCRNNHQQAVKTAQERRLCT
ncbi:hypothetical protein [uncultured Kocuria sp.]|nr:hypothetical protein [uncultured Kocuria sp.]